MASDRYRARGVSPRKEDVHAAVRGAARGLFPTAFCQLVPDTLTGSPDHCLAMHADGAGTKAALAYLHYRETGDATVFRSIAQDALVMNLDDLLCVGATGPFMVSNTIGRNARLVPGEVVGEIIAGFQEQAALFAQWGMEVRLTGGETADVGDVVRTLIVDATVAARQRRERVIANDRIAPGDIIIGLGSEGQAAHETRLNSGIGSNGLTSARHDLLAARYGETYPETVEPGMAPDLRYSGPYILDDPLPGSPLTVGEALRSPTRTHAPLIAALLRGHWSDVHGLVHCTGGGQTKCLHAGRGVHYVKDDLFPPPTIFRAIQQAGGAAWREMYEVFNMGHRMEIFGPPALLSVVEALGALHGIAVRRVGHCEAAPAGGSNRVTVHTPGGLETYEALE